MNHVFGVISKNILPDHRSQRFSHVFSSKSCIVLHLHLWFILSKVLYVCTVKVKVCFSPLEVQLFQLQL